MTSPNAEHFRFFDNREKYLLFVTTCSEKWEIARRVSMELERVRPTPPALRLFDAGMGDGTVLTTVMRTMHAQFRHMPWLVVGKEISFEDVRQSLEKLADRFSEHPLLVVVITNMLYSEAPWLRPRRAEAAEQVSWRDVALNGSTAFEFDQQIRDLVPQMVDDWQVRLSERTGNPLYVRPSVLVLYRADQRFALDQVIPRRDGDRRAEGYDLVIASQPYRARMSAEIKVRSVIAPLARSLAPGGRMLTVHSYGNDPGMEIIHNIWSDEDPFRATRHEILEQARDQLADVDDLDFEPYSDDRSIFKYQMYVMPSELVGGIGTSTALAAWNAAIYVAQIGDDRLGEATRSGAFLDTVREVLQRHSGLWFNDESFVIARDRIAGPLPPTAG